MNEVERGHAMRSAGVLDHEIPAGKQADRDEFDRVGYAVGRAVLDPEVLREVRAPWVEALIADGFAEPVEGDEDRFRWIGDRESFDRGKYRSAVHDRVEELLVRTGAVGAAIEATWGRRAAVWTHTYSTRVIEMAPGAPIRWHRDGWPMKGRGGPGDHVNFWIPLTRLGTGDGPLGLAVGSQRMAEQPHPVPAPHPLHLDADLGGLPPDQVIAPLWRTSSFDVGDALLFDPYHVHSPMPNDRPYLRLATVLIAQDAAVPLAPRAGLSTDLTRELTDVEWLALAVLSVQPSTPWFVWRAFYSRGVIGRLWTEQSDDLVEQAIHILHLRGLIEPHQTHGDIHAGDHRYFQATPNGHKQVCEWLAPAELTDPGLLAVRLQFCTWLNLDPAGLLNAVNAQPRR